MADAHAKPQLKPTIKWVVNHVINGWLTYKQNNTKQYIRVREASHASRITHPYVNLSSNSFFGSFFVENFWLVLINGGA